MRPDYKDFEKHVEQLINYIEETNKIYDLLYKAGVGLDKILEPGNRLFDQYCDTLDKMFGLKNDWMSWFIFDNKCGKEGLQIENKPIKTIKEFYRALFLVD